MRARSKCGRCIWQPYGYKWYDPNRSAEALSFGFTTSN
jgi:hypothetical protein